MNRTLLDAPTPFEYFREQVVQALEHQKLEISAFAEHYVVALLAHSVRQDAAMPPAETGFDEMPLALMYVRALRAAAAERARRLREMGDTALFVSGFFADSLIDKAADLRYYRTLGGDAYARLGREGDSLGVSAAVFSELAERFQALADVLSEISERSQLASPRSVLRLYERWLQTRSERSAQLLADHGILPMDADDARSH